jgi:hypothetical protein
MMVHLCDGGSTCHREAENVNTKPSCEITGGRALSCKSEWLAVYGTAFGEKVSHDPSTDFFTIVVAAISEQARRHHAQSNPQITHIMFSNVFRLVVA